MAALQQAAAYKQEGFDDAAKQVLTKYGLTDTMLDSWQGLSQADQDKLTYLTTAAGLAGSGYDTAARNYLTAAGLGTDSIDYYSTVANRQNQSNLNYLAGQLALQNRYRTTGTGRGSSKSGGSSRSSRSSGTRKAAAYTQPQLNTMLNKYNTMKPTDQGYDYYTETLADAGRIPRLSGTGNPGRSNGTAYEQGMYHARQWANGGYSQSQIASKLANETGLSNDLISSIMNQIDYEWRGTK